MQLVDEKMVTTYPTKNLEIKTVFWQDKIEQIIAVVYKIHLKGTGGNKRIKRFHNSKGI